MDQVWITSIAIAAVYAVGLVVFVRRALERRLRGERTSRYWVMTYASAGAAVVYLILRLVLRSL